MLKNLTHTFIMTKFLRSKVQNMPHFIKHQVFWRMCFLQGAVKDNLFVCLVLVLQDDNTPCWVPRPHVQIRQWGMKSFMHHITSGLPLSQLRKYDYFGSTQIIQDTLMLKAQLIRNLNFIYHLIHVAYVHKCWGSGGVHLGEATVLPSTLCDRILPEDTSMEVCQVELF